MSLLTVTPSASVRVTEDEVAVIANKYGYTFKENEKEEFTTLVSATCNAMQFVAEMDDYQPEPDFTLTPREDIYFPNKEDNPDNAWAYRCKITHKEPKTDLLAGKTFCIKDNICVAGVPCLVGTETFTGFTPKVDATLITRILEAGGSIVGKAVCENLSVSATSYTAATGPISNPYVKGYSAGGSSSGTANLVALGEVDMGIGADQGGSIRIPSSLCGLYGFKATTGLVPYTGCISNEAIIDYAGPMTRTLLENAVTLEAIAGVDGYDDRQRAGTPFPKDVPHYSKILIETKEQGVKALRIGTLKEALSSPIIDSSVKAKFHAAAAIFAELGAMVEEVSIPMHDLAPAIFTALSRQGQFIGRQMQGTGRRQLMLTDLNEKCYPYTPEAVEKMSIANKLALFSGDYCWQKYPHIYAKSVNLNRKLTDAYDLALGKYDVLIMPTTITPADPLPKPDDSPIMKMRSTIGKLENTCPFNSSGHPALAMPIGFVPAKADPKVMVPASMQIVGKYFDELTVLKVAFAWENAKDWKKF